MSLNSVKTEITVDGEPCDYIYMQLDQSVSRHHSFEIAVNYRHQEESVWAVTVDEIFRTTLNKPVFIKQTHMESGVSNEFEGLITDIKAVGLHGDRGTVILRGGSPTLLLDRDPAMDAFVDYTLYNIVSETIENSGVPIQLENNPKMQTPIPYVARYNETSFAFLSRILSSYGEWFYYNGRKLVIGRPVSNEEVTVSFDMELSEVESMGSLNNLNTVYYDYNPEHNSHFVEEAGTINNSNLPMKAAKQAGESLYTTPCNLPVGRSILGEQDMTKTVREKQSRQYVSMSKFKATSNTCAAKIGEVAIVTLPKSMEDVTFKNLGSFLVTEVTHTEDKDGYYTNSFAGIAGVSETLPDDYVVQPQAFPEPAIVTDNRDPRNQGRVKVRFYWQSESESSNWVRVQTPDAGSSETVANNRGFVFIPEIDDQVMVGYEHGNPSRPYVMGSLFHRDNSGGAADSNSVKSIITRSGHTIKLDDTEGEEKISIYDNEGSIITFDTQAKSLTISANENVDISAKNINITAEENIVIGAKANIDIAAEGDLNEQAQGNVTVQSGGDTLVNSEATATITATGDAAVSGQNVAVGGQQNTEISGGAETTVSGTITTVQGAAGKTQYT